VVVIATYRDPERAQRMRDWMLRSHISARLRPAPDGYVDLTVADHEERRATDLLFTLIIGLDTDRLGRQPRWKHALILENALSGAVAALAAFLIGLAVMAALPFMPLWAPAILVLACFTLVASLPGRAAGPRPVDARRRRRPRWSNQRR
jgi:hypothetical protein